MRATDVAGVRSVPGTSRHQAASDRRPLCSGSENFLKEIIGPYLADMRANALIHAAYGRIGDGVGGGEDLVGLFVEQKMIVAEMRPR